MARRRLASGRHRRGSARWEKPPTLSARPLLPCARRERLDRGCPDDRSGRAGRVLLGYRLALASDAKAVAAEWSPSPMNAASQRSPRPVVWDPTRRYPVPKNRAVSASRPLGLSRVLRNRRSEVRILSGALPLSADRVHLQGLRCWRALHEFAARKLVSDSGRFSGALFGAPLGARRAALTPRRTMLSGPWRPGCSRSRPQDGIARS
jgi:hypothetical protein